MLGLSWFQILWLWPVWFVLLLGLVHVLQYICEEIQFGSDAGYMRDYNRFMDDARNRGLNYRESMDELEVRTSLAKLRRVASDAVATNPMHWKAELDGAVEIVGKELQDSRPDLVPVFAATIRGLDYGSILYPHEAKLVDRQYRNWRPSTDMDDQDMRAALRIAR
ncbi:hypothetical protein [Mesorhizobium sp. IMUNJ 23232]|uniref:hypothetical protein n=1 Tax=Mesorhizobium sp. IMUNJ 23232 TaxID=3376064 RepID=UPI0037B8E46A